MSSSVCEQFGALVGMSESEIASMASYVTENGLAEKLSEHLAFARKRPGMQSKIKEQWLAKIPKIQAAIAPPTIPGAETPPPIVSAEAYSHAAIAGASVAGNWTMQSACQAGASSVWRKGLENWLPCDKISVQPAKPIIPIIDGFPVPWPIEVELAKNGKFYANLRGSMKPLGKGKVGIEVTMLRALLGDDPQYREAILAEVTKLQG